MLILSWVVRLSPQTAFVGCLNDRDVHSTLPCTLEADMYGWIPSSLLYCFQLAQANREWGEWWAQNIHFCSLHVRLIASSYLSSPLLSGGLLSPPPCWIGVTAPRTCPLWPAGAQLLFTLLFSLLFLIPKAHMSLFWGHFHNRVYVFNYFFKIYLF